MSGMTGQAINVDGGAVMADGMRVGVEYECWERRRNFQELFVRFGGDKYDLRFFQSTTSPMASRRFA